MLLQRAHNEAVDMKNIIGVIVAAALFGAACTPEQTISTDVGVIDRLPHRSLVSSPVQAAAKDALLEGMREMNASGGAVVILDVNSGQIMSLLSVANDERTDETGPNTYNRAINPVHLPGSTMAIFPVAQALDQRIVDKDTLIETPKVLAVGRYRIRAFSESNPQSTPREIFLNYSHVGAAQLARKIGRARQREFLSSFGFNEPNPLESAYPTEVNPPFLATSKYVTEDGKIAAGMLNAYGQGDTTSPVHLAAAFASLVNGGMRVFPTFREDQPVGDRVISFETSLYLRELLAEMVQNGVGRLASVEGYAVGGTGGTADMWYNNAVNFAGEQTVATFVAAFPMSAPEYVVVTLLEDPTYLADGELKRTAGWTAASVTSSVIEAVGPYLVENQN